MSPARIPEALMSLLPFLRRKLVVSTGEEVDFYYNYLKKNVKIQVFLQPEWNSKESAIPIILELLKNNPIYRLSLQTHKFIGVQ